MTASKSRLLAAAALLAHAATAQAQYALPQARIVGAGSSAVANTLRQASDCYGLKSNLGFGTPRVNGPAKAAVDIVDFDLNTPAADTFANRFNCAADAANAVVASSPFGGPQFGVGRIIQPNIAVEYLSVGSGEALAAFTGGRVSSSIRISRNFSDRDGSEIFGSDPASCALLVGRDCPGYDNADGYQFSVSEVPLSDFSAYYQTAINPFGRYDSIASNARAPGALFGAPIQIPVAIVPVALAYSPVYAKQRNSDGSVTAYRFTVGNARADGSGGLRLTRAQYCAIFNGTITNWNQLPTTVINKDPADTSLNWATTGLPIYPVGRAEAAGTTTLLTRALAAQCDNLSTNTAVGGTGSPVAITNKFDASRPVLPHFGFPSIPGTAYTTANGFYQSVSGAYFDKTIGRFRDQQTSPRATELLCLNDPSPAECAGLFTIAEGDDGVAMATAYLPDPGETPGDRRSNGRIGYVSPEQTLPATLFNAANGYGLNTASLQVNGFGFTYASPDAKNAIAAFAGIQPPQSKGTNGVFCTAGTECTSHGDRRNQNDWVQGTGSFPFARIATPTKGYPIVGTSNVLLYTCYASPERRQAVVGLIATLLGKTTKDHNNQVAPKMLFNDPVNSVFARNGLASMPLAWANAITWTFLSDNGQLGAVGDPSSRLGDRQLWIQSRLAFATSAGPVVTTANPRCAGLPGA